MADLKPNVTVQVAAGPALTFPDTLKPEGYAINSGTAGPDDAVITILPAGDVTPA